MPYYIIESDKHARDETYRTRRAALLARASYEDTVVWAPTRAMALGKYRPSVRRWDRPSSTRRGRFTVVAVGGRVQACVSQPAAIERWRTLYPAGEFVAVTRYYYPGTIWPPLFCRPEIDPNPPK